MSHTSVSETNVSQTLSTHVESTVVSFAVVFPLPQLIIQNTQIANKTEKNDIKKNFHILRKSIEKGEKSFDNKEWFRMKQLLDTIIYAFAKE